TVKSYAYTNQKRVLENDLQSRKLNGWVEATNGLGSWRVRYIIKGNPKVSIIIPTKDKYPYILKCLDSIIEKTSYQNYELVIIDTGSKEENVWNLYEQIINKHKQTRIIKWNKEFNFSSVCNFGASYAKGEYLIFLNNDTEILTPDWIEGLLEHGQRNEVGAVGCMLLYPDQSIQHLGGILGISGSADPDVIGVAGHAYRGRLLKDFNHFDKGAIKNYSFVTAACLLISKKKFYKVGQFDPKFKIAFNDVDFGLRVYFKHGLYNLINPFVRITHNESVSVAKPGESGRNIEQMQKEITLFVKRWGKIKDKDPFYNPNLTKTKEDFSLNI
ncbi:MAG: glycosyltransferase, partial [bacterium]|nr:glycosyltransferase [bacterium]